MRREVEDLSNMLEKIERRQQHILSRKLSIRTFEEVTRDSMANTESIKRLGEIVE